jgi:hypothetical protein
VIPTNATLRRITAPGASDDWDGTTTSTDRWQGYRPVYYTEEVRRSALENRSEVARTTRTLIVYGSLRVRPNVGDTVEFRFDRQNRTGTVEAVAGPRGTRLLHDAMRTMRIVLGDE